MVIRDTKGRFAKFNKPFIKFIIVLWILVGVLAFSNSMLEKYISYRKLNDWTWRLPITITTNKILTISEAKPLEIVSPLAKEIIEEIPSNLTPIEQKILDVFGIRDFTIARAVAKCESGFRENAININENNTIDLGIF